MKKFISVFAIAATLSFGVPKANAGLLLMTPVMMSVFDSSGSPMPAWANASAVVGAGVFGVGYFGKHLPFINPNISAALIVLEESASANMDLIGEALAARFPFIDDVHVIERLSILVGEKIEAGESFEIAQGLQEVLLEPVDVERALEAATVSGQQAQEVANALCFTSAN